VPDSLGGEEGKTTKGKFKIPEELGAKTETRKGGQKEIIARLGYPNGWCALSFWLVPRSILTVGTQNMRNYDVGIKCWLSPTRAVEGLQQKKYTQERDAEARIKQQNAFILQRQAAP
jgi:hypothetical protein